jgi:hypothetical protein
MKPLAHDTLPLALTAAFTPRAPLPAYAAGAWTRALARASAGAAPAVAGHASGPHAPGQAAPHAAFAAAPPAISSVLAAQAPSLEAAALARTGSVGVTTAPRAAVAGQQRLLVPPHGAGNPSGDAGAMRAFAPAHVQPDGTASAPACEAESEPGHHTAPAPRTRGTAPEPAALRIHVELHDEGLAVWLGLDAQSQAAAAHAAGLLEQLRRNAGSLPRLALLVCNGIPLHAPTRPSKETP